MSVDADAIRRVAARLDALGLRRSAVELREAIERAPDERVAPVQRGEGAVRLRGIPWGLHELLWRVYADHGHGFQSAERLAERGGFSRDEIGQLAVGDYNAVRGGRTIPIVDLYREARG